MDIDSLKIEKLLTFDCKVEVLDSVDSTNNYLKAKVPSSKNVLVVAKEQTMGKGRLGKSFYSAGNGIYMSLLLKKTIPAQDVYLLTVTAAIAVTEILNELFKIDARIKWVNDVYCNQKKLCGILCEAAVNKDDKICESIIGIGINTDNTVFPSDIADIAISLADIVPKQKLDKNIIITSIINRFYHLIENLNSKNIVKKYKALSLMYGKSITVISGDNNYSATVIDIDDKAQLIVKKGNGEIVSLNSGEISVKL